MPEKFDGFVSLLGGMHGGLAPELIKEDTYARGLNISSREGLIHTRPKLKLETSFPPGAFMGAETWSLNSGDRTVFVIAGKLYVASVDTWALTDLGNVFEPTGRCFFCQVDRYLVVQDGTSPAKVIEEVLGIPVLRTHNVPIGTIMAYTHGRLHMVSNVVPGTTESGKPYFISGDILLPNDPSNVLNFTETTYWNEGGAHGIPEELGYIYGIQSFRNAATGTGAGGLVVLGKHGSSAFDMSLPRSKWNSVSLAQVLFNGVGTGTISPYSLRSINDDLIYRGLDGIRMVRYSKTELAGSSGALSCVPMSNEVTPFIENESNDHLPNVSAALSDNRVFMTAGGKWVPANDVFTSMIVMDLASIYGMKGAPAPAYDGIWTGVNPRQVLTAIRDNKQILLIISEGNKVYSLSDTEHQDAGTNDPLCRVYTKVMYFPDDRVSLKEIKYVEVWVSDIYNNVDLTVHFRPEGFPLWSKLGVATIVATEGDYPQRRRKLRIPLSDDAKTYDPVTKEALYRGTGFQFCLEWSGHMQLDTARFCADAPISETPILACNLVQSSDTLTTSNSLYELDDYVYDIEA